MRQILSITLEWDDREHEVHYQALPGTAWRAAGGPDISVNARFSCGGHDPSSVCGDCVLMGLELLGSQLVRLSGGTALSERLW